MATDTPSITSLHDLLDYDASKFTSAEIELRNSLQHWINRASSPKLKSVLQRYHDYVQQHLHKMEIFFQEEKITAFSISNKIMMAFIAQTEEKLSYCADASIKDACLLACVQAINHFKISTYGTAAAFAKALDMEKFAQLFHEAEVNEKQIDDRLSQLAEHEINMEAKTHVVLPR